MSLAAALDVLKASAHYKDAKLRAACPTCGRDSGVTEQFTQATRSEKAKSLGHYGYCPHCEVSFRAKNVQQTLGKTWSPYKGHLAKKGDPIVYNHGERSHLGVVHSVSASGIVAQHHPTCCGPAHGGEWHPIQQSDITHIDTKAKATVKKSDSHIWDRATSQLVTKSEHGHGGHLFDTGFGQSQDVHGGSHFDEGFRPASGSTKRGERHDDFTDHTETTGGHGERYDDWPWRDMPSLHSDRFDTDFKVNVEDHGHGSTWYDVFRGGRTAVRYIFDGKDYEGTIISLSTEEATVQSASGARHEIGLPQILAYATRQGNPHADEKPSPAKDVDIKAETAEEAHDLVPTRTSPSEPASGGRLNANRRGVNVSRLTESIFSNKALLDEIDVSKAVDSTETSTQSQDTDSKGSSNQWCPHCKHTCKSQKQEGICPTCGGRTETKKSLRTILDVLKEVA